MFFAFSPLQFALRLSDIQSLWRTVGWMSAAAERLIGGHLLRVVNWTPREEPYQHNRKPFSDICLILWTQPALVFSLLKGDLSRLCLLCLKIRAGVGANYAAQWQPGAAGPRGVDEPHLKGKLSIQNTTQQETTAARWLSAHYGRNKRTLQRVFELLSSQGDCENRRTWNSILQPPPHPFVLTHRK